MIVTTQKLFEKIVEMAEGFNKVFVIGCGLCATECQTGGKDQVDAIMDKLRRIGKQITGSVIIESPCDKRQIILEFKKKKKSIVESEAILVLSCGVGVQTAAEVSGKICIPGLDTRFIGMTERIGRLYERCGACGDCKLFETGGICPIVRCPKGILNGPCAGHLNGKCEVDRKKDCAWILIYKRMKDIGQKEKLDKFIEPRDYRVVAKPQEIVWR